MLVQRADPASTSFEGTPVTEPSSLDENTPPQDGAQALNHMIMDAESIMAGSVTPSQSPDQTRRQEHQQTHQEALTMEQTRRDTEYVPQAIPRFPLADRLDTNLLVQYIPVDAFGRPILGTQLLAVRLRLAYAYG